MNELHETIEKIYNLISSVSVSGDDIEKAAAARELLRQAYRQTGQTEEQKTEEQNNG